MSSELIQKLTFPLLALIAAALFTGLFFYAGAVDRNDPPPPDAKEIFEDSLGKPSIQSDVPGGTADLSIEHMSGQEVARWVEVIAVECLSLTPSNFDENTRLVKNYFTEPGYQQYQSYLAQTKFAEVIKGRGLQSGAILERPPLEANSMVQNGVYKWLYEVPITLSFIPAGQTRGSAANAQNQRFTLRLQLTRAQDPQNPNRIKVEIWQILPARG